jgi:RimK-like ATP-grasp domain
MIATPTHSPSTTLLLKKTSFLSKQSTPFLIRLFNWEYWSFGVIYTPIYFYWFYLCAKAKSLFFFSASNPTILNGGFLMECKSDIYSLIPQQYYPKTVLIPTGLSKNIIEDLINRQQFSFPIIVKPDIGGKGRGVKRVHSINEAIAYINTSKFNMLAQEFIDYENEVGIFYYRYPWETSGHISGIVGKEFLTVVGNGINTIQELIEQNERYILQLPVLKKMKDIDLNEILAVDVKKILVPFGNHARGAKFLDLSYLITPQLENALDKICKQINGFYYGRLDVKFSNWEDLVQGKNLSIIELNGAGSEPTHMYDPKHSIFFAWKEIIKHWKILWKISRYNHLYKECNYLSFSNGLNMFKENSKVEKKLDTLS